MIYFDMSHCLCLTSNAMFTPTPKRIMANKMLFFFLSASALLQLVALENLAYYCPVHHLHYLRSLWSPQDLRLQPFCGLPMKIHGYLENTSSHGDWNLLGSPLQKRSIGAEGYCPAFLNQLGHTDNNGFATSIARNCPTPLTCGPPFSPMVTIGLHTPCTWTGCPDALVNGFSSTGVIANSNDCANSLGRQLVAAPESTVAQTMVST